MVWTLSPAFKLKLADAEPDVTMVVLTLRVALAWLRVGVMAIVDMLFGTEAV